MTTYDASDPRSALLDRAPSPAPTGPAAPAQYYDLSGEAHDVSKLGSRFWYLRGQNFVVQYSRVVAGERLARVEQVDEWVLVVPEGGAGLRVSAGGNELDWAGQGVVVVPPGPSEVVVTQPGCLICLFTTRARDVVARCVNGEAYKAQHNNVAPLVPWPAPVGGYKLRAYPVGEVAPDPGRFGRIFRCTTFMVNYLYPEEGPREVTKLSPHTHPDFEQCSLTIEGEYVHHIRSPWTARLEDWRDDEHEYLSSPGVVIIPPPAVHTSQGIGSGPHQLIDIFCGPRVDFSSRAGWVLNADAYPAP